MSEQKNFIITITGDLGSGKGAVCQIFQDKFNFKTYSTGDIQRQIAARYNMTTLELNKYSETHPEIDDEIDSCFSSLSQLKEDSVIDSRMAWHFILNSFKIYLAVDLYIAADRIMNAHRGNIESYGSIEEAMEKISERKQSENKRYKNKYNVDCGDMNNFDLVVDTSHITPEEAADIIMSNAKAYFENR